MNLCKMSEDLLKCLHTFFNRKIQLFYQDTKKFCESASLTPASIFIWQLWNSVSKKLLKNNLNVEVTKTTICRTLSGKYFIFFSSYSLIMHVKVPKMRNKFAPSISKWKYLINTQINYILVKPTHSFIQITWTHMKISNMNRIVWQTHFFSYTVLILLPITVLGRKSTKECL